MENPYQAPQSELADIVQAEEAQFYVVSISKFLILYAGTLSIYSIYWFYRHWQQYRIKTGTKLWPVPRSIFSIFFAHSLFSHFDKAVPDSPRGYSAYSMATVFVLAQVSSTISDRMADKDVGLPFTLYLSLGLILVIAWALYRAQRVANEACGDPTGESNRALTAANIAWLVVGGLIWVFFAIGLYEMTVGFDL